MAVIGVYDSGIGGLTSVKIILERFVGNDIYYLADNLNHPFGTKDADALKEIVDLGIKKVKAHCDIAVIACNTASSITEANDVVKLLPPLDLYRDEAQSTLLMATTRTIAQANTEGLYRTADTPELATLIEVQASLNQFKSNLNMGELLPYLAPRLHAFKGVKRVILGCSHYLYCKPLITKCLGDVEFADGNEALCQRLSEYVTARVDMPSEITFDFTSSDEKNKYINLLKILMNGQ